MLDLLPGWPANENGCHTTLIYDNQTKKPTFCNQFQPLFPPSYASLGGLGCFFQNDIKAAFATKELETRQAMMYNASKANLQPFQGPGTRPHLA